MSTEQAENLEAILRQSAFPAGIDVGEQRRLLRELTSAQPLPAGVTVTAAALGGVPTAEITIGGIEPRHVVLYFHGGVYVLGGAAQAAGLASQVGRRTRAKVITAGGAYLSNGCQRCAAIQGDCSLGRAVSDYAQSVRWMSADHRHRGARRA